MFIGRRQDDSIYGRWTVKQWDGQEEVPDDHPDAIAPAVDPIDQSDLDLFDRKLKAVCMYFAQATGKTQAQVRAGIKAAFDSLQ